VASLAAVEPQVVLSEAGADGVPTVRVDVVDGAGASIEAHREGGRWVARGPAPDTPVAATATLVDSLVHRCHQVAPGAVHWWLEAADDTRDALARERGFVPDRQVLQLRRPLPAPPADLATRPFSPGADEPALLACNNAAFAWHEEQGGWDQDRLEATMAEEWFDPAGLLLHEIDGELAGFCWTKVHAAHDPPLGEIFVIGVHPRFQGRGLGRHLTLAGLDHLAARGLAVAMLYVEHDNAPALALYDSLGFREHHRDRRYVGRTATVIR
jgi:mycothiol synthase